MTVVMKVMLEDAYIKQDQQRYDLTVLNIICSITSICPYHNS